MRRMKLAAQMTLRSVATGLAAGTVMGALSGPGFGGLGMYAFVSGLVMGAAFGLGLGIVGGLLLGTVTAVFFYPLRRVRLYRAIAPTLGAVIAGSGAAMWGPWAFSSTSMTPLSAVTIGFGSVLVSLIAGWSGVLAAQDVVRWYAQISAEGGLVSADSDAAIGPLPSEENRSIKIGGVAIAPGWIGIALLAFAGSFGSYSPLWWLVCGTTDVAAALTCLPSPRLYTSVAAGFKATLPIILTTVLVFVMLKKIFKRYRP